jgi:hypothetical protein
LPIHLKLKIKISIKMKKQFLFAALSFMAISTASFAQSGNVGIGTTSPTAKLHVNGNVRIVDGTQGVNKVLTSDASGTASWRAPAAATGAVSGIYEAIGTTKQIIAQGTTADINGATITVNLTNASTVLITYSALGLPQTPGQVSQGTIDLLIDNNKVISSFYSGTDGTNLTRLSNYCTSQKVVSMPAGTHTIKLQSKSWAGGTVFNGDPVADNYAGALASDANAMKARISLVVLNN